MKLVLLLLALAHMTIGGCYIVELFLHVELFHEENSKLEKVE